MILPLPPLAVQNSIVAKLEQVLPLVDAYENAILQKEELKSALPDKVKKAILQEAITGKLTEAWRKTATIKENGKQLLDCIIEERNAKALADWEEALKKNPKAKKPVAVVASEIEEDEIPFEVPESWCWCRLGDLVPFGQCENAEPNEIEDDAWILDLEDIEKDSGRILQFKTKKEVDSKSTKHIFNKGYVLYSKLRPYLNKCVIAPQDGYCTSEILPLNFGKLINNKFAQTFLMSPYFVDYTDSLSFGVKMPRLGTEDGKKALVPLPPLEEQEEIVKKVEELLPLCK
ncbi:MAG: restriction endonuclease subunit S [Treponema sp.]|nr:restriction endonuclease subunit S [Treponema sp.]